MDFRDTAEETAFRAEVQLLPDGSVKVLVGVTDIGTGAKTTMGLIAAETLGVPLESIAVVYGDTDIAPYSPGESGSRTTGYTGMAVIEAAQNVRKQLLEAAAERLQQRREDLDIKDGKIVSKAETAKTWNIAEVAGRNVDALVASVTTNPQESGKARMDFAAHFTEVEVNLETGKVRVMRYVAAQDSGTIINRLTAASQVKVFIFPFRLSGPQDFIIAPTITPAVMASIQLPKNQLHASVRGMGI